MGLGRVERWEARLTPVFREIDHRLEAAYGKLYPLHPARPSHGTTACNTGDGLFDVGAAFTAGFGSRHGRGYVVGVRLVTLDNVPAEVRESIGDEVAGWLRELLPAALPNRKLEVVRDGTVYKIVGDLSLDDV